MWCGKFLVIIPPQLKILFDTYDLQMKSKKFKWAQEAEKVFNEIKELSISPPVLRALTPEGLFQLESDTLHEGVRGTLFKEMHGLLLVIIQKDYPLQLRISELLN